jgi:hypothetical protein
MVILIPIHNTTTLPHPPRFSTHPPHPPTLLSHPQVLSQSTLLPPIARNKVIPAGARMRNLTGALSTRSENNTIRTWGTYFVFVSSHPSSFTSPLKLKKKRKKAHSPPV